MRRCAQVSVVLASFHVHGKPTPSPSSKYGPRIFKIATLNRWLVVVSGTQHIEELRKAAEDDVSFTAAAHKVGAPLFPPPSHSTLSTKSFEAVNR